MDKTATPLGQINLINVRLAFPALWTPTSMKPTKDNPNPKKQYSATFLVKKGSKMEKLINETIEKVAQEKWKKDGAEVLKSVENNTNKSAWIDGDGIDKRKLDGYPEHRALTAKNDRRPTTLNRDGSQTTEEEGTIYAGCNVNAQVEIWAQDNAHGRAIRCSLLGVVYHSKNDSFGGGRVASANDLADLTSDEEEDDGAGMV